MRDTLLCLHAQSDDDLEILVLAHRTSPPVLAAVTEVAKEPAASRIVTRVIDVRAPGRSASLIAGLHAARGLYVAALDDDDTVLAHWVETFRGLAEQSARPAVLRCRAVSQPMELLHDPSVGFRASNAWASPWKAQFSLSLHWLDSQSPIHVCAYPREEMLRWGLTWDPSLQVVEDWDLLARAASRLGVRSSPEFTAIYRRWPATDNSYRDLAEAHWGSVREDVIGRWDEQAWVLPQGSVRHLIDAELALLSNRPLRQRITNRLERLAARSARRLVGTRPGRLIRWIYRRTGLRAATIHDE
ncbi:MAG: glycosyltransferase family A protein [Dermatophilaceae bacterium]